MSVLTPFWVWINFQPVFQPPVASMVTPPPRLMASERAKYKLEVKDSAASRTRQRSIKRVKLGPASAARTAMIATTTSSSMAVKPLGPVRGGVAANLLFAWQEIDAYITRSYKRRHCLAKRLGTDGLRVATSGVNLWATSTMRPAFACISACLHGAAALGRCRSFCEACSKKTCGGILVERCRFPANAYFRMAAYVVISVMVCSQTIQRNFSSLTRGLFGNGHAESQCRGGSWLGYVNLSAWHCLEIRHPLPQVQSNSEDIDHASRQIHHQVSGSPE